MAAGTAPTLVQAKECSTAESGTRHEHMTPQIKGPATKTDEPSSALRNKEQHYGKKQKNILLLRVSL